MSYIGYQDATGATILPTQECFLSQEAKSLGLLPQCTCCSIWTPLSISATISDEALKAAQDFVETSNQHVAFLAGRGDIAEAIDMFQVLKEGM